MWDAGTRRTDGGQVTVGRGPEEAQVRRAGPVLLLTTATALLVGGCVMASPPPPVQPSAPAPVQAEYPTEKTIHVATDAIGAGFNPHLAADQSTVTTAIGTLTLPSAFDPVVGRDGELVWRLSDSLLTSAEVRLDRATTVVYRIQTNAQWSDGLPITGDDFALPAAADVAPAQCRVAGFGCRPIDSVQTGAGGKSVTVTFAANTRAGASCFHVVAEPRAARAAHRLPDRHGLRASPSPAVRSRSSASTWPATKCASCATTDSGASRRSWTRSCSAARAPESDRRVHPYRRLGIGRGERRARPGTVARGDPNTVVQRNLESRVLDIHVNTRSATMRQQAVRAAVLGMIDARIVPLRGIRR